MSLTERLKAAGLDGMSTEELIAELMRLDAEWAERTRLILEALRASPFNRAPFPGPPFQSSGATPE